MLLRFLLVEAAQVTVRSQAQWRSTFFHLAMRRGRKIAKVAMARKLAVHLYCYGPVLRPMLNEPLRLSLCKD